MLRHVRPLLLFSVVPVLLGACAGDDAARRNVIVLIDYSGSTAGDQMLRYGTTIARDVVANLHERDAISVYPIDAGAVTRNSQVVGFDLQQHDFTGKNDGITHAAEEVLKRVATFLAMAADSVQRAVQSERGQRQRFAGKTDILGALRGVSTHFEHEQPISRTASVWNEIVGQAHLKVQNVVVICSDMINESDAADFEAYPPSVEKVDSVLARIRRAGGMPELKDAVIFVTGRTGRNAQQVDGIKAIWTALFHESHADLRAYDFDSGGQMRQFFAVH